jgi:hypothetical protein
MKKILCLISLAIAISIALMCLAVAQEDEKYVCLIYFTSRSCGDDCGLTDTFLNGLMKEYEGNLFSITYQVDASQENQEVFNAFGNKYDFPPSVPILLFGKDDFLAGKDNIYAGGEDKILGFLNANGTNCPLESGFIPPAQLGGANLPGQPQINVIGAGNATTIGNDAGGKEVVPNGNGKDENGSSAAGQNPLALIFTFDEPAKESFLSLIIIIVVLIVVGFVVLIVLGRTQGIS